MTPALVIDAPRVRRNVATVLAMAGGNPDRWRCHLKTTKTPAVWAMLLDAGIRHFKCATTRELETLLELVGERDDPGVDVLLAYPLVGPALDRAGVLATRHPGVRVSVLVEAEERVAEVAPVLGIHVDVNPGMNRTGIPEARSNDIAAVARAAGPRFRGLHVYDGHLDAMDPSLRRTSAFAVYTRVVDLVSFLATSGVACPEIVTSGTPTLLDALAFEPFAGEHPRHRVSPGTLVFHDLLSEAELPGAGLVPAALVATRVVSHPREGWVTCDAGTKALASEAGRPIAAVIGRPDLLPAEPSEEHLPIEVQGGSTPRRGDVLMLAPRHVCPTVNLAETALLVDGDSARIVRVSARAHDAPFDMPT